MSSSKAVLVFVDASFWTRLIFCSIEFDCLSLDIIVERDSKANLSYFSSIFFILRFNETESGFLSFLNIIYIFDILSKLLSKLINKKGLNSYM